MQHKHADKVSKKAHSLKKSIDIVDPTIMPSAEAAAGASDLPTWFVTQPFGGTGNLHFRQYPCGQPVGVRGSER